MERREALLSLAAAIGVAATPELVEALQRRELSEEEAEALLRAVAKVEPRPGEANQVRARLSGMRFETRTDPRVQPALGFNPEVEP
jgi:hypothetical protein